MRRKQLCLLLGLILILLLTACSQQSFISQEPTNYIRADRGVPGRQKIYYLLPEHPDVQLLLPLIEQFLSIDQTQDYRNPDWIRANSLATAELIASRYERESNALTEHEIIKQVQDLQVQRIVFMGDTADVTAEVKVVFTNVSAKYAGWYNITPAVTTTLEATVDLRKIDEIWLVNSARYSYLAP